MNIDYKLSVMMTLSEYGEEFARTRTLNRDAILKVLSIAEILLNGKDYKPDWERLYKVISQC